MGNTRILAYLLTVTAAVVVTMLLMFLVMNPPMGDLLELGKLLGITAIISAVVGYLSHRLGWWRQFRSLAGAFAVSYLISAGLTLINVWVTARLMFINEHDLSLATLLLIFASGISVSFGVFIANSSTLALKNLSRGAEELSAGDFSTRVPVDGQDEIARLTERFNIMAERLEQAADAEKSLNETRRNLVAWASHDLRTPLSSLRAMIDALAEGVADDPETQKRYLRQSQAEIDRMSRLINDLFELAQLDAGGPALVFEATALPDLISDALEGFTGRAHSKGIQLSGTADPELPLVNVATDKIGRVLNNLIDNALRYTPKGGSVSVAANNEGQRIVISVCDTGTGIAPEDRDRIFEHFYRGEKSRSRAGYDVGGSGLGLAIAKSIVEAHGGEIWLDCEVPSGTTIRFSLPLPAGTRHSEGKN